MHTRPLVLAALALFTRFVVRLAPIVGCVVLAAKARAPAPVLDPPASTDPTPAPADTTPAVATAVASPLPSLPSMDALTTPSTFSEVKMVTARTGWAWGGAGDGHADGLWRTGDGGLTWNAVGPSSGCEHFVDGAQRAWVVTCDEPGARAHFTTDGGRTWSYTGSIAANEQTPSASALQFTDASHGSVVLSFGDEENGETNLYRTSDGGRSWREVGPALGGATMAFADERHGWRSSSSRQLERTADGGATWSAHPDLVACTADQVPAFTGRAGWVLAACPSGTRAFYTSDGGDRWLPGAPVDVPEPTVSSWGGADAWILGDHALLRTHDGGRTIDTAPIEGGEATTLEIVSPDRGFAVRRADDDLIVSRTTDGGKTFSAVLTTPSSSTYGLSFPDPEHGVFFVSFGTGTRVMATSDGGASWRFLRSSSSNP